MPEPTLPSRRPPLGRFAMPALLVVVIAIVIVFFASNGNGLKAADCQPQPDEAKIIDQSAMGNLAALNGTGTGRGYGAMTFEDPSGKQVSLKDFAGKTLLINFWASWCIPCRAEMPALDKVAAEANDDGFMVLPINLDLGAGGRDKAQKFLSDEGIKNLPLYADPTFDAFKRLQTEAVATGLPTTLLVDRKGCEVGILQGPAEWDSADGTDVIKALKSLK